MPSIENRPRYLEYLKRQFRFSSVWVPAVLVAGYIQWRAGGFIRILLLLVLGVPAAILFATWWEWRKTGQSDE
ncbi:MAG: hypothetical protein ACRD03_11300 [Acidimicrobiales bacterium]